MKDAPINFRLMLCGIFIGLGLFATLNQQWFVAAICGVLALAIIIHSYWFRE